MPTMLMTWVLRVIALAAVGPVAGALSASVRGADGSGHATLVLSASPMSGIAKLAIIGAMALVMGVLGARLVHRREGVLGAGIVLGWGAWGMARVDEAIRTDPGADALTRLALEGAIVVALVVAILVLVHVYGTRIDPRGDAVALGRAQIDKTKAHLPVVLGATGVACVVAIGVSWVQVPGGLSGQSVWGGFIGGLAGGLAGAFVLHSTALRDAPTMVPMILGVALAAVAAPLLSFVVPGPAGLMDAIARGTAPGFVRMSALAWACGALVGVPLGYGWVESSMAKHDPKRG